MPDVVYVEVDVVFVVEVAVIMLWMFKWLL